MRRQRDRVAPAIGRRGRGENTRGDAGRCILHGAWGAGRGRARPSFAGPRAALDGAPLPLTHIRGTCAAAAAVQRAQPLPALIPRAPSAT